MSSSTIVYAPEFVTIGHIAGAPLRSANNTFTLPPPPECNKENIPPVTPAQILSELRSASAENATMYQRTMVAIGDMSATVQTDLTNIIDTMGEDRDEFRACHNNTMDKFDNIREDIKGICDTIDTLSRNVIANEHAITRIENAIMN